MPIQIQKTNLFPTTVFSFFLNESFCDQINNIVEEEKDKWNKGLLNVRAKTSNWEGLRYKPVQEISNLCTSEILPFIGKSNNFSYNNWSTQKAWINFYQKGDSAKLHHHFFNDYCAILITKTNEESLKFYSPNYIHNYKKPFEQINSIEKIKEKKGLFIFFPSCLFHSVDVCKDDRISVAFNFLNQEFVENT